MSEFNEHKSVCQEGSGQFECVKCLKILKMSEFNEHNLVCQEGSWYVKIQCIIYVGSFQSVKLTMNLIFGGYVLLSCIFFFPHSDKWVLLLNSVISPGQSRNT